MTSNNDWDAPSEMSAIEQRRSFGDPGAERDWSEPETPVEYNDYPPALIDEYFVRTPPVTR